MNKSNIKMPQESSEIRIRQADMKDLEVLVDIEARCFPPEEAADRSRFEERLKHFSDHFWLAELDGKVVGFIDGMVVDTRVIDDEMYAHAEMHQPEGAWQSVFGLNMLPEYRRRGYAAQLMTALIEDARMSGRKGCILTCKDHMIHYYERFGYQNMGASASTHGHAKWNDMILEFDE